MLKRASSDKSMCNCSELSTNDCEVQLMFDRIFYYCLMELSDECFIVGQTMYSLRDVLSEFSDIDDKIDQQLSKLVMGLHENSIASAYHDMLSGQSIETTKSNFDNVLRHIFIVNIVYDVLGRDPLMTLAVFQQLRSAYAKLWPSCRSYALEPSMLRASMVYNDAYQHTHGILAPFGC